MTSRATARTGSAADLPAVLLLLLSGLIVGWPVLAGGFATYLDNPVHLAEVLDLAGEAGGGWSDLAFCGFPLGTLHSPVWFGLLARGVRLGLPAGPLYCLLAWAGFCLPALALYYVARRRLGPFPSGLLAYTLLIQRPSIVGISSAFGGMWTFYIAAAGFILLADRWSRPSRSLLDLGWMALLASGIGLTHSFVALSTAYLFAVHLVWTVLQRRSIRIPLWDAAACLLGAAASAAYWLPSWLARGHLDFFRWDLTPLQSLAVLLVPSDMHDMLFGRSWASGRLFYTDALPLLLPVAAGIAGTLILLRKRRAAPRPVAGKGTPLSEPGPPRDPLPVYGSSLALLLLVLLLAIVPHVDAPVLGPVSWRHLYFVRVALALAAMALLGHRTLRLPAALKKRTALAAVVLSLAAAWWWGLPLRDQVPPPRGAEMDEVRGLWSWLKANRNDSWGRVYLQDTFLAGSRRESGLAESHILALTAHESGVRQLGAYYRLMPFRTSQWTQSEGGLLFGRPVRDDEQFGVLLHRLRGTNCTHLVLAAPQVIESLAPKPPLRQLYRSRRFAVLSLEGAASEWILPASEGIQVRTDSYRAGEIAFTVQAARPGASVMAAEAYHPFWKLEGPTGSRVTAMPSGLMRVENLPAGMSRLRLIWHEPGLPAGVSVAGWALLLALLAAGRKWQQSLPVGRVTVV